MYQKFCKCGCGQEIIWKKYYSYYGIPNYILGHHSKGKKSPFEGRKHTEESKRKISLSCSGQKRSEETKIRIAIANIGKKLPEYVKIKISKSHKGKHLLKETKIKIANKLKGRISPNRGNILSLKQRKKISANNSGKNNPRYIDGRSFEPYCEKWDDKLKKQIKMRDNYQCQNPSCLITQLESLIIYKQELSVHHIHYDKKNPNPDLITLCRKCNAKANKNREYWEGLYMNILNRKI